MNTSENKLIYTRLKKRGIHFKHVCEVGVYLPETSNVIDFIKEGVRATLVEADPDTVKKINDYFSGYSINVFPVAVWDESGVIKLSRAAASTFVTQLSSSPAIVNDQYKVNEENTFEVQCCKFSEIDDGTIDLLSVDIEGGEWYVIKHMVSRPPVISIETHGKYYTNPFIKEIESWMLCENYVVWYKDLSDTVFIKKDFLQPDLSEAVGTRLAQMKLSWKKFKRIFKI
jgi:FkbM family methyltransferase